MAAEKNLISICHRCPRKRWDKPNNRLDCGIDGRNIVEHARTEECPEDFYAAALISPDMPVEQFARLIPKLHNFPLPAGWHLWPNAQSAYRHACADYIAEIPPFPAGSYAGRGVVIVGGGPYFASALTLIKLLRHLGCMLPVELWTLPSELPAWQESLVVPLGVRCVRWNGHAAGKIHGWELKTHAALHTSFAESIHLDADCFPVRDPTYLFDNPEYQRTGAIFWPDIPNDKNGLGDNLLPAIWEAVGLPHRDEPAFESGQFVANREKWWRGLNLSHWLCRHGWDYYFKLHVWYGDKECPHIAARLLGLEYAQPEHRPCSNGAPMLLQRDFDGSPLFAHHTQDKFWLGTTRRQEYAQIPLDGLVLDLLAEAQADIRAARPPVYALVVCIDFADYLSRTIDQLMRHVDGLYVVTTVGDTATQELCRPHGATFILCDRIHANGSKFNLGAARNDGFRKIASDHPDGWILSFDADCIAPQKMREKIDEAGLNPSKLYGALRQGGHHEDNSFSGFFQLFNASQFSAGRKYDENHYDASLTDIWFRDLWPESDQVQLDITVQHLGRTGVDHEGRISAKTDGRPATRAKTDQERWREFHLRPAESPDLSKEPRWLDHFLRDLRCGQCKTESPKLLARLPMRFYDRESLARWGWEFHEATSARLPGKKPFPWSEACKLYRWPATLHEREPVAPEPNARIRIFGLQRSATNLSHHLIANNFGVQFASQGDSGWKHGRFDPSTVVPADRFVLCVRSPLAYLASFYRYACRDYGIDHTLPPQVRPGMTFTEFLTTPCYEFDSPAHRWSAMYAHWLEALPMDRTVIVRQEDSLADQSWVVGMIGRRLGLVSLGRTALPAIESRRVDVNGVVRDEPAVAADLSIFTPELRAMVAPQIDAPLLARFGYSLTQ